MCQELRDELIRDEGLRLSAYKDSCGFWTIGVGHLLGGGDVPRMASITNAEAMALLEADVNTARETVEMVFPDWQPCRCGHIICSDERVRDRALVNMAFNRGLKHMQESTTITPAIRLAIVTQDWEPVAAAIAASPWAQQIKSRATRLAFMLKYGEVMP